MCSRKVSLSVGSVRPPALRLRVQVDDSWFFEFNVAPRVVRRIGTGRARNTTAHAGKFARPTRDEELRRLSERCGGLGSRRSGPSPWSRMTWDPPSTRTGGKPDTDES